MTGRAAHEVERAHAQIRDRSRSVTSGTALHNTKLPLRTWLIALYLITASSKGISALKLSEWLGVRYTRGRSALERLELLVHVSEGPLTYGTLTA